MVRSHKCVHATTAGTRGPRKSWDPSCQLDDLVATIRWLAMQKSANAVAAHPKTERRTCETPPQTHLAHRFRPHNLRVKRNKLTPDVVVDQVPPHIYVVLTRPSPRCSLPPSMLTGPDYGTPLFTAAHTPGIACTQTHIRLSSSPPPTPRTVLTSTWFFVPPTKTKHRK